MTSVHDWRERRCDEAWSESAPGLQAERWLLLTIADYCSPRIEAERWRWSKQCDALFGTETRWHTEERRVETALVDESGREWTVLDKRRFPTFSAPSPSTSLFVPTPLQRISSQPFLCSTLLDWTHQGTLGNAMPGFAKRGVGRFDTYQDLLVDPLSPYEMWSSSDENGSYIDIYHICREQGRYSWVE